MNTRKQSAFWLAALLGFALSSASFAADKQKLTLTGSSTIAPLASEIAKRYEAAHPDVRVDVQTGGSSRGIADARTGLADIGMSSRALKAEEKDGLREQVLAYDGVCFLIHRNNPVKALSDAQLLAIYTGQITNWKSVGGRDAPITVITRAEGRSEVELFNSYFKTKSPDIKASLVAGENQQGIKTLVGNPDAIVYMSIGTSESELELGAPIKLLPLNGVEASTKSVANGSYPMGRPLVLVTKATPSAAAQAFIDYALSAGVHDLVKAQSFVPRQ